MRHKYLPVADNKRSYCAIASKSKCCRNIIFYQNQLSTKLIPTGRYNPTIPKSLFYQSELTSKLKHKKNSRSITKYNESYLQLEGKSVILWVLCASWRRSYTGVISVSEVSCRLEKNKSGLRGRFQLTLILKSIGYIKGIKFKSAQEVDH